MDNKGDLGTNGYGLALRIERALHSGGFDDDFKASGLATEMRWLSDRGLRDLLGYLERYLAEEVELGGYDKPNTGHAYVRDCLWAMVACARLETYLRGLV